MVLDKATIQKDLLTSALEGGSNYWYMIEEEILPPSGNPRFTVDIPFRGGALIIRADGHDNPAREDGCWLLDRAALDRGWAVMAANRLRHFADAISENSDASTGDVYLQVCLFGEVVFG